MVSTYARTPLLEMGPSGGRREESGWNPVESQDMVS